MFFRHASHLLFWVAIAATPAELLWAQPPFASHPPLRPLPTPSQRRLAPAPAHVVDPVRGDDANEGSRVRPWKTLAHAVTRLKPGGTLYLRGGTYYEHVVVTAKGATQQPITIRSYPGELAVLDGGLREFYETPEKAWEKCPDGVEGEFRSVKTYPDLGGDETHTNVLGNFGDSMVPLHGYRILGDLRTNNIYWNLKDNVGAENHIYCGPGLFYDVKTGRIHIRLAPTKMKYLPEEDNYRGETDPRKLRLVIAGHQGGPVLALRGAENVRVQDLVIRGARGPTIEVSACENIEFDGLTVYGGSTCFQVKDTAGLRLLHTACRGIAAPWTFRGSLKYRAIESRLFSASDWIPSVPGNRDFELAWCEFTDSVDGVFVGNVKGVRIHHCLLDNVTDDGIFLTAGTAYDGTTPGGDVHIYQNLLSRCLTTFAFGVGHGRQKALATGMQTGSGVYIYRNVFDYRRPVLYHQPTSPAVVQEVKSKGRVASDHGGPTWEPMTLYHNTILADDPATYAYGTVGLGDHINKGTRRRVFNNIIVQLQGLPGNWFPPTNVDFQADGNLHWSAGLGSSKGNPFAKFRQSKAFAESKARYAPGWGAGDRFADPKFVKFATDWKASLDLSLQADSPAIDMGMTVPGDWPDPVRDSDRGKPDAGALPLGVEPWHVGIHGRLTMFGETRAAKELPPLRSMDFPPRPPVVRFNPAFKPAALVEGYPARDVPLVEFALVRHGVRVDSLTRKWLGPGDYQKYGLVVLAGNLIRAKIEPNKYTSEDLRQVEKFLTSGGTLLLMLSAKDVFATSEGQKFLTGIVGEAPPAKEGQLSLRHLGHAWVKHLDPKVAGWVSAARPGEHLLRASKGERIIASPEGHSLLYRVRVGKGQLIYVGWEIHDSLPQTRSKPSTPEQERTFEDQMRILFEIVAEVYPTAEGKRFPKKSGGSPAAVPGGERKP